MEDVKIVIEYLNRSRPDGYPKIKEIVSDGSFKVDVNDENFKHPLYELEKEY